MTPTREVLTRIAALPPAKREAALSILSVEEWDRCAASPLYWLFGPHIPYVYTLDHHPHYRCNICQAELPHHKRIPHLHSSHSISIEDPVLAATYFLELPTIRPFPHKPYFEPIINAWLTEQLLLIEKSRDMMATWLFVALYTWDTIFHQGRQNFFQSKSAKDTIELVRRAHFIYRHQPRFLRRHKFVYAVGADSAGELRSETLSSEIIGLPQGSDKIRQYHPTGVFTDETAFHPDAAETFAAVKPAIQAGGRYTGVSSAAPSWFMQACLDTF